jgi:hypothetical protein
MTESEISYFDLLSHIDDPESPNRPDRIIHPANYDYAVGDEDDEDEDDKYDSLTPSQKMFGRYEKYYTPEERKKFAAIPVNDPSYEIDLLCAMLLDIFAMVPAGRVARNHPLPPQFFQALITTVARALFVLSYLVALNMKLNGSKNRTADLAVRRLLGKVASSHHCPLWRYESPELAAITHTGDVNRRCFPHSSKHTTRPKTVGVGVLPTRTFVSIHFSEKRIPEGDTFRRCRAFSPARKNKYHLPSPSRLMAEVARRIRY